MPHTYTPRQWRRQIETAVAGSTVSAALLEAIVTVESDGYPWAYNPEPQYRWLWDLRHNRPFRALTRSEIESEKPPVDFSSLYGDRDQEWWAQQASFGLCQIMGAVAREHGYRAPSLLELCDPDDNLVTAVDVLTHLLRWAGGDMDKAAAAYNAGIGGYETPAGQLYASTVSAAYKLIVADRQSEGKVS